MEERSRQSDLQQVHQPKAAYIDARWLGICAMMDQSNMYSKKVLKSGILPRALSSTHLTVL
jgi:hypothetical protein